MNFSSDYCFNRMKRYNELLTECILEAWRRWSERHAPGLPGCRPRAKRGLINELIVQVVREKFDGVPGIKTFEDKNEGRFLLIILGTPPILIRFKHLLRNWGTNNLETEGSIRYERQMSLEFVPKGLRLNAGYELDASDAEMKAIAVTMPNGKKSPHWSYPLWERGAMTYHLPPPQTNLPLERKPGKGRRVQAKNPPIRKREESSS